jgi:hypothetical protein
LNAALQDRIPYDSYKTKQVKRAASDIETQTPVPKKRAKSAKSTKDKVANDDEDEEMHVDHETIVESTAKPVEDSTEHATPASVRRRKKAKIVGGWVSPQFAKEIDRSWLNEDEPADVFDVREYVPQVGDIVL